MLTPEQARAYLKSRVKGDFRERAAERIRTLPGEPLPNSDGQPGFSLRQIAFLLLGYTAGGVHLNNISDYAERREVESQVPAAYQAIMQLDTAERRKIFDTVYQHYAPYVERLWHDIGTRPYQQGLWHRAFRASGRDDLFLQMRTGELSSLTKPLLEYDENIFWLAEYAGYFQSHGSSLSNLFAAAINLGGETGAALRDLLIASARGEHETGIMGQHVIRALLLANDPVGWEFIEKMLLSAQRAEGLRQSILECIDVAHPTAFRRMLQMILDHDLIRFPAVVRAANIWFGFAYDSSEARVTRQVLQTALTLIDDVATRRDILASGTGEQVYLALWTAGTEDAPAAVTLAEAFLKDSDVGRRFAAVYFLDAVDLPDANSALIRAMDDPDGRIAMIAATRLNWSKPYLFPETQAFEAFEAARRLLKRLPKEGYMYAPIVWDWLSVRVQREMVAGVLFASLGNRSPKELIPLSPLLVYRDGLAHHLIRDTSGDPEIRTALLGMVGDRDARVREIVGNHIRKQGIRPDEAPFLESLLTRTASGLRRQVIALLQQQPPTDALASADRLIGARKPMQRAAGLELLAGLRTSDGMATAVQSRVEAYRTTNNSRTEIENQLLETIVGREDDAWTRSNGFGLFNPANRTQPVRPTARLVTERTPASRHLLKSLDALIHEHRHVQINVPQGSTTDIVLLGNSRDKFPSPAYGSPISNQIDRLPLAETWQHWLETRPQEMRDPDELELVRAWLESTLGSHPEYRIVSQARQTPQAEFADDLYYPRICETVLLWLVGLQSHEATFDFLLNVLETQLAAVSDHDIYRETIAKTKGTRRNEGIQLASYTLMAIQKLRSSYGRDWTDEQKLRLWHIDRWIDEPVEGVERSVPSLDTLVAARELGAANDDDIYDNLLQPPRYGAEGWFSRYGGDSSLYRLTTRRKSPLIEQYPPLDDIVNRVVERILTIELKRGEMPTEATHLIPQIACIPGIPWFIRFMQALSGTHITRLKHNKTFSRGETLSSLLAISYPSDNDTPAGFAKAVKAASIKEPALIEAAVFVPQWSPFIEAALGWDGLSDAVWWLHAHGQDKESLLTKRLRTTWSSEIARRTTLSPKDRRDGAVDVAWFLNAYKRVGEARWDKLYKAAKYVSDGIGHTRARLFADAMLGRLTQDELSARVLEKRQQDAARALGLLPLDAAHKDAQVQGRYGIIQEFIRTGKKGGPQRRIAEKRAAEIALDNLARTAGYDDPSHLAWAMEARTAPDFADGRIVARTGDYELSVTVDYTGRPELAISRKAKPVRTVPPKLKKEPAVAALLERMTALTQQHTRMRASLEQAMVRATQFPLPLLRNLLAHPVLSPMIRNLVFTGDAGMGYLVGNATHVQRHDGSRLPLPKRARLRIAHPHDLFQSGEWHLWQRECFSAERIQPFKQIFREYYPVTEAERGQRMTRRYAGQQVNPRQAVALFNARDWTVSYEYGVFKTLHHENIIAQVDFPTYFFTPAEIDGATIESLRFTPAAGWGDVMIDKISPISFSEVMRDLDLVVSVAHRSGFDPEFSASTIDMRGALITETAFLLRLPNVRVEKSFALIEGKLGDYSVHLGSGVTHRQPGGALAIVPVHAQHRGRIFLPFVDDDPKTAEVLSKVILLAQDDQIKDPSILSQIYAKP
ncbi:MAG: DUF4132 domain-containing protein [Pleurocapsa minor GSE-CHR-MK-17-07R]|jgi:hypothetical protein|nr:DUF4132 domain-containing protein [Pleurocapsa minor GSE-CHR-MK 17-07R]